jgi:hypothetical protein
LYRASHKNKHAVQWYVCWPDFVFPCLIMVGLSQCLHVTVIIMLPEAVSLDQFILYHYVRMGAHKSVTRWRPLCKERYCGVCCVMRRLHIWSVFHKIMDRILLRPQPQL